MRRTTIFCFACLCMALIAPAVEKQVNFSGTWLIDKSKSNYSSHMRGGGGRGGFPGGRGGGRYPGGGSGRYPGGGGQGGEGQRRDRVDLKDLDLTLVIEQSEREVRVTRKAVVNGEDRSVAQVYKLDGSDSVNPVFLGQGQVTTKTSWDKDKLVTLGSQKISGRETGAQIAIKEEYSLSKDGKVLTLKATRTSSQGSATD